jgi:hypothetical protein
MEEWGKGLACKDMGEEPERDVGRHLGEGKGCNDESTVLRVSYGLDLGQSTNLYL